MASLSESTSEHPLAKAILTKVNESGVNSEFRLESFKNMNGEGVEAVITKGDVKYDVLCGNDKLMDRHQIDLDQNGLKFNITTLEKQGKTVVTLAVNKKPRLLISLEEQHLTKPDALPVVKYLRHVMRFKVAMITGDNKHSALKVANHLGIPESLVTYRAYPDEKKRVVQSF